MTEDSVVCISGQSADLDSPEAQQFIADNTVFPNAATRLQTYVNMLNYSFVSQFTAPPTIDDVAAEDNEKAIEHWPIIEVAIDTAVRAFEIASDTIFQMKGDIANVSDDDFLDAEDEIWGHIRHAMQHAYWEYGAKYRDNPPAKNAAYLSFRQAINAAHVISASFVGDHYRAFQRLSPLLCRASQGDQNDADIFVEGALRYLSSINATEISQTKSSRSSKQKSNTSPHQQAHRVGGPWFHQLSVLLLHLCQIGTLTLTPNIVELASCVSTVPNASAKNGKAARFLKTLREKDDIGFHFVHEAPAHLLIARRLSWELAGLVDANHQLSYMRSIERAVAFCWNRLTRTGQLPNANEVHKLSGLSWKDADDLMRSYVLLYEIDDHDMRVVMAMSHIKECEECQRLLDNVDQEKFRKDGKRFPSTFD